MPNPAEIQALKTTKHFFDTATQRLDEEDSGFAPQEGMFTVANEVAPMPMTRRTSGEPSSSKKRTVAVAGAPERFESVSRLCCPPPSPTWAK